MQQSVLFNLYSIATYSKHLFTIILIIHVFSIFHRTTDIYFLYIHFFCYGIKIVKECLFFLLLQYSIEIPLHTDASMKVDYFCRRHLIMNNQQFHNNFIIKSFVALSKEFSNIYGDIHQTFILQEFAISLFLFYFSQRPQELPVGCPFRQWTGLTRKLSLMGPFQDFYQFVKVRITSFQNGSLMDASIFQWLLSYFTFVRSHSNC